MTGAEMMDLAERLYPINRSVMGNGLRETLAILSEWLPLDVTEVPTGTDAFDWVVPQEWNVEIAWIKGPDGRKIIDFADSNLHVVTNSSPVHKRMTLPELEGHLYSLAELPDAIPYRRGNQDGSWGFCLSDAQRSRLVDGEYEVFIDSSVVDGSLTYGEILIPGTTDREIMLSAHTCHPSLANDNLSGVVVAAAIGRRAHASPQRRFGVRIIFAPATLGSITWLSRNPVAADRMHAGLTLACLGDSAPLTYKRSFDGNRQIDRVASKIVASQVPQGNSIDFFPFGYDERQYNSPGFRLPVGSLMRSRHGTFPEYHTSADDLEFINGQQLEKALDAVEVIVDKIQTDPVFRNLAPYGEPQLGKRGLYESVQNAPEPDRLQYAVLWMLSYSDGHHGISEISDTSGIEVDVLAQAADILVSHRLLEPEG